MQLVMPNPYSVFMHDTRNKTLFEEDVPAFGHGCIRTGDAISYAATLLEGVKTREEVDAILASGQTNQLPLGRPIPLFVTYFTAVSAGKGGVTELPDIYNWDRRINRSWVNSLSRLGRVELSVPPEDQTRERRPDIDSDFALAAECWACPR